MIEKVPSLSALLSQSVVEARRREHKITIYIHTSCNSASGSPRICNVDAATASNSVHIFIVGIYVIIFIFTKSM